MDMSPGCPAPQAQAYCAPESPLPHPIRGPHGGWQKHEIEALQKGIQRAEETGESLRSVFDRMSRELGRKPNSIRNFYYAQVRTQPDSAAGRALPFETFTQDEVEQLVRRILASRAQGMSVRACVRQLADGDRTRMLRYQNKYRSTLRTRPELVRRIMDDLRRDGVPYVNPYDTPDAESAVTLGALHRRADAAGDAHLSQLFASLDYLMDLALSRSTPAKPDAAPADSAALRRADRLHARCDLLRIALDDEQTRHSSLRTEAGQMVSLLKEYIALPDSDRLTHCSAFCSRAAARLSAVECALMEPQAPSSPVIQQ